MVGCSVSMLASCFSCILVIALFCFVLCRRSVVQFFVFVNFSNVLQAFLMYLNLRVHLLVFVFIGCVFMLLLIATISFCLVGFSVSTRRDLPCFVHFVSISVFLVFLDSFCRPCCVCVLVIYFVKVLEFYFVFYVMTVITFCSCFPCFKVCFCLSELRVLF